MNISLNDYIQSMNSDVNGTKNGQNNAQQNVSNKATLRRNHKNNQRNKRNGNSTQFGQRNLQNRAFDLRFKCGRKQQQQQRQQQPQQQKRQQNANTQHAYGRYRSNSNSIAFNASQQHQHGSNQCQHHHQHHTAMTNSHAMQYNACNTVATLQNQQQLMPICHQHMSAGNANMQYGMLHQHPMHSTNAIVPVGMHQHHHHHNAFGCQAQCAHAGSSNAGNQCVPDTSNVLNALSKLFSTSSSSPLKLTVQIQPQRIADDVEEINDGY